MNNRISNADELSSALPFGNTMLPTDLVQSEIMNKIIVEIYNGWVGQVGLERVVKTVNFLCEIVPQYAKVMDKSNVETLEILAKSRNCNYTNYFQECNLPKLSDVYIFETENDFFEKFPSKEYQCPSCSKISTDYQKCNSDYTDKNGVVCNWKVYGLFGSMGKGIKVLVKDRFTDIPKPIMMFKPIELLEVVF
jgi:hypothetical protein